MSIAPKHFVKNKIFIQTMSSMHDQLHKTIEKYFFNFFLNNGNKMLYSIPYDLVHSMITLDDIGQGHISEI